MSVDKFEFSHDGRDIVLLDSLPLIYHPIQDFRAMTNSCGVELSEVYSGIRYILDNQFISEASEATLSKWEKYLKVTPNGTDTLEERRFRILAKLNDLPPYTDKYLETKLTELCGSDNFHITRDYSNFKITIELSLDSLANTETVENIIRSIIPANLDLTISWYRMRNYEVAKFTHEQLASYTQDEIKYGYPLE